jgi:hypothetical protein
MLNTDRRDLALRRAGPADSLDEAKAAFRAAVGGAPRRCAPAEAGQRLNMFYACEARWSLHTAWTQCGHPAMRVVVRSTSHNHTQVLDRPITPP